MDDVRASRCTPERPARPAIRRRRHARGGRRRRRSPSSRSTSPSRARCRCAATRSAPTAASSPSTCPRSRSTCTTARSTCRTLKELARRWYPDVLAGGRARPGRTAPSTTSARASTSCASTASGCSCRCRWPTGRPPIRIRPRRPRRGGPRRPRRHLRPTAGGHQTTLPSHRAAERQQHRRPGEHREEQHQRHGEERRGEPTERADAAQHPPQLHGGDAHTPRPPARARRADGPPTERSSHHVACTCRVNHAATSRASAAGPPGRRRPCSSSNHPRAS